MRFIEKIFSIQYTGYFETSASEICEIYARIIIIILCEKGVMHSLLKFAARERQRTRGNLENGGNGTIHPPVHDTKRITRNSITDEWNPRGGVDRFLIRKR